jgi:hypothetical protein
MTPFYIRALGITTIKNVLFVFINVTILFTIASRIPQAILTTVFLFILGLNTFLFSEWIFVKGYIPFRTLVVTIAGTFVWDFIVWGSFFSWLYQQNMFLRQTWFSILIPLIIHVGAMWMAYVTRKRSLAESNTEGLI